MPVLVMIDRIYLSWNRMGLTIELKILAGMKLRTVGHALTRPGFVIVLYVHMSETYNSQFSAYPSPKTSRR